LRHHPLKTGALDAACSGTAKIIIDHLDLGPAKCSQAIAHGVLQRAALPRRADLCLLWRSMGLSPLLVARVR